MFCELILVLFLTNFVENNVLNNKKVVPIPEGNPNDPKLLIILVDGFRWDYVSRDNSLKGFPRIAENGVHAEFVKPIFPANSYPNWYAISTGLYAESHGIMNNYMYDKQAKELFLMGPGANESHSHWWNQTEPLWISAEKNGINTSMYLWDGCQVTINGTKASYCYLNMGYYWVYDFKSADRITRGNYKKILDDFSQNKYRLSFLYHELVDRMGHVYGSSSNNVTKAVQQIDAILYDLYNEMIVRKLDQTVNVVIISDHGMTDLKGFKKIYLNESIDFNDIELMLGWGSDSQIIPKPGKEDLIFNQLSKVKGIKVYKKNDIPEQFHYKNNNKVLPILVNTEFGYGIAPPKVMEGIVRPTPRNDTNDEPLTGGNHGYDHELSEMRGIMYAFGPAFKKNFTSKPIEMVDHYNLFSLILGITPHPNNGTFEKIKPFFKRC